MGTDQYISEAYSQAIGGPRGFGLILDENGSDRYSAYHPQGHSPAFVTIAQGVGVGVWRVTTGAFDTGGIGVLCDLAGNDQYNDQYQVGEWGQGFGMFYGLGILHDRAGNDAYNAGSHSQASAVHGGVGILADDGGHDSYWATGLSQSYAKCNA
jgi:hypothetical protein